MNELTSIRIDYDAEQLSGTLWIEGDPESALWDRIRQSAASKEDCTFSETSITLPWTGLLAVVREFAPLQKKRGFRLKPTEDAKVEIDKFVAQYKTVKAAQNSPPPSISEEEINSRLEMLGFTKRRLREFQVRDLKHLLSLQNGANFSVPGAGKTTVTFALHLLTRQPNTKLIVIGPKSAFSAWSAVVDECVGEDAPDWVKEPFRILTGGAEAVRRGLMSDANRFVINYEQLLSVPDVFTGFLARNQVHLVLDESHRMKGGLAVKRGIVLLNAASLPVRRDILSGTPMPQSPNDLRSQLDFLWPGAGLGLQIATGRTPRDVIGNLYVRTTKHDLDLPPVQRHFRPVGMSKGQSALYAIVRSEALRDLSSLRSGSGIDVVRARRSVMRLLQLSTNPVLALNAMARDVAHFDSGIAQQVLDDGPSPKMLAVRDLARSLAAEGRKTVIWSIFTDTIEQLERMLADLNPVTVYGAVPSGDPADPSTREGRLRKFHEDPTCMSFIANPAAAGEGISLHHVCHDAIYLDRSYNSTHYLQSIDRIHRLGLPAGTETNVFVFQTMAPKGLGCVDHSVSRRLASKLRAMQELLDDTDLHQIALDEEEAEEPIDYDIEPEDLIDLIEELEGRATFNEDEGV
ncbi:DEAD/DEAH box helicase [Ruegeria sp. HKCCC1038]|uniref:SNF2-related protein n=1 Tax=Ruegeria sp. HKCCC1038 TaxID=2682982 RepID=UPI0014882D79|nr:DEAD/DEAH box helicase [Ruegeria sp. HKCCC1038]